MSQNHHTQANSQGSNVRMIPIFVEGRDEPVINRDIPDSSSIPSQEMPPRMAPNMDFGTEMPSFGHSSIFDRAKDFPVRSFPSATEFFNRGASPARGESPARHTPSDYMHEQQGYQQPSNFNQFHSKQQQQMPNRRQPSPQPQQYQQQYQQPSRQQTRSRTSSRNSEEPQPQVHTQRTGSRNEMHQASPVPQPPMNQQQQKQSSPQPAEEAPPKPPQREGPIEKIQKIQQDVLNLMIEVEKFNGKTKKNREYLYLDEMLTQNLIRLDDIETEGKESVKLARKEAIKCINRCLNVLEAKADAAEQMQKEGNKEMETNETVMANNEQQQNVDNKMDTDENKAPSKQSSRGSIYDNHDPNTGIDEKVPSKESTPKLEQNHKESSPIQNHNNSVATPGNSADSISSQN